MRKLFIFLALFFISALSMAQGENYLCFTAESDSSSVGYVTSCKIPIQIEYSFDRRKWFSLAANESISLGKLGDRVYLRGRNVRGLGSYDNQFTQFVMSGSISASGSVMSLLDAKGTQNFIRNKYCFYNLFKDCASLVTAPELGAIFLADYCYKSMFANCVNLRHAPDLPSQHMKPFCYAGMFDGCVNLQEAPNLRSVMGVALGCFHSMFRDCVRLRTSPVLMANTMAESCYSYMFQGCIHLSEPPVLPAKILASKCYQGMFYGCTGLITPPELPADKLEFLCYAEMFFRCSSMTSMPDLPATQLADSCYKAMFMDCPNVGEKKKLPPLFTQKNTVTGCFADMYTIGAWRTHSKDSLMGLDEIIIPVDDLAGLSRERLFQVADSLDSLSATATYAVDFGCCIESLLKAAYAYELSDTKPRKSYRIADYTHTICYEQVYSGDFVPGMLLASRFAMSFDIDTLFGSKDFLGGVFDDDAFKAYFKLALDGFHASVKPSIYTYAFDNRIVPLFKYVSDADVFKYASNFADKASMTFDDNKLVEEKYRKLALERAKRMHVAGNLVSKCYYKMAEMYLNRFVLCDRLDKIYIDSCFASADNVDSRVSTRDFWRLRGDIYAKYGDYNGAVASYRKAISLDPQNPDAIVSYIRFMMATNANETELNLYINRLESLFHNSTSRDYKYYSVMQEICEYKGDYARALRMLDSSFNYREQIVMYNNGGSISKLDFGIYRIFKNTDYMIMGNDREGIAAVLQSLAGLDDPDMYSAETNAVVRDCYYNIAGFQAGNGDYGDAISSLNKALVYANKPDIALLYARCCLALGRFSDVVSSLRTIDARYWGPDHYYLMGLADLLSGKDFGQCSKSLLQADALQRQEVVDSYSTMGLNEFLDFWGSQSQNLSLNLWCALYNDGKNQESYLKSVYNSVLFRKNINFMSNEAIKRAQNDAPELYNRITYLRNELYRSESKDYVPESMRMAYFQELDSLKRVLSQRSALKGSLSQFMNVDFASIRGRLSPGDLVVEFARLGDYSNELRHLLPERCRHDYVAFAFTRDSKYPVMVDLFTESDLMAHTKEGFLKTLGERLLDIGGNVNPDKNLKAIYGDSTLTQFVWGKILSRFGNVRRIYFSPVASLYSIGVEYLRTSGNRCMADDYDMRRITSSAQIAGGRRDALRSIALWGGVDYDADAAMVDSVASKYIGDSENIYCQRSRGSGNGLWRPLEWSLAEVESIDSIARGMRPALFTGRDAVEESFKAVSGNSPDIIHIATHGDFKSYEVDNSDSVLVYSSLIFAGANNFTNTDSLPHYLDDGVLNALEISNLNLQKTKLVVMSACMSGLGNVSADGLFGLCRGFKLAGVKTIVMSLWSVDDRPTMMLMKYFYQELRNGKSVHEAFNVARNSLRADYPHPMYWAPFVIMD